MTSRLTRQITRVLVVLQAFLIFSSIVLPTTLCRAQSFGLMSKPIDRADGIETLELKPDPDNFRCVFIGDSQVSSPHGLRMRPYMRLWDLPTVGAFFSTNFIWAGQEILFNVEHIANLSSRELTNPDSWTHGGPRDFMNYRAYEWMCDGDVDDHDSSFATLMLYNDYPNLHSWPSNWMLNRTLVLRIAVRTTPQTVPLVETVARRGSYLDQSTRTVHKLPQEYGYTIIEQVIRSDFHGDIDGAGVELFMSAGVVESAGMTFQILGSALLVVDEHRRPVPGYVMGAMASPGWGLDDHLAISQASREAAARLIDANSLIVMLGHNPDSLQEPGVRANYFELMRRLNQSFALNGVGHPVNIHVVPWVTGAPGSFKSLLDISTAMNEYASQSGGQVCSFVEYFDNQIPDVFDSELYLLDVIRTHPGNSDTAENLSLDLEILLRNWFGE